MDKLQIRRFENKDATALSELIQRNFMEINIKDYPRNEMERLSELYNPDKLIEIDSDAHLYVAAIDNTIVGCGAIAGYHGKQEESLLLTIFVLPEYQGKGIGSVIIETLENDEYFLRAKRIELHASITACDFYLKLGYRYKDGKNKLNEEGLYLLEKFR